MSVQYIDGEPATGGDPTRSRFVAVLPDQLKAFRHLGIPTDDMLLATFFAVVNACQTVGRRDVFFGPGWTDCLGLRRKTVRGHLDRLERRGVIKVEHHRGKAPTVTLSERVPLRPAKTRKRKTRPVEDTDWAAVARGNGDVRREAGDSE